MLTFTVQRNITVTSLSEIKAPIAEQIETFESRFRGSMKSSVPLLDTITRYIIKRKGKQMRPMFVFLSAGMCGTVTESTYRAASLIELLHTATLVHDDVVDDSNLRRGFFSINALWKNKIAVLVGDYLLSKGLLIALEQDEFHLLKIVSDAVREMSEGELLQIEKARKLDIQEPVYFEIIRKKTASLIASCCACGAASVKADEEQIKTLWKFGEYTGTAFQIKDDLFDYERNNATGKPYGTDIRDQKMTLPLIYLLNKADWMEKRWIINTVKSHHNDAVRVAKLISMVSECGGLDYAREKMVEYRSRSLELLKQFPDNIYRKSLEDLVIFTTERDK
ncbi:MAG: polyprenyl synthetase family protein [Bacteroidetes bacterium]|nr:polyprenyl synthetase family protein [Bacteroidota bacterium]